MIALSRMPMQSSIEVIRADSVVIFLILWGKHWTYSYWTLAIILNDWDNYFWFLVFVIFNRNEYWISSNAFSAFSWHDGMFLSSHIECKFPWLVLSCRPNFVFLRQTLLGHGIIILTLCCWIPLANTLWRFLNLSSWKALVCHLLVFLKMCIQVLVSEFCCPHKTNW